MRQTGDLRVLLRHTLGGVDQDQTDVGAVNGVDGAQVGKLLDGIVDLGLAAHTGRVDEAVFSEFIFKIAVDGVARRACDVRDDHALLAEDAVEQAGLADIRLADDGDVDDLALVLLLRLLRQVRHAPVEQIARAVAVDGGHLDRVAQP